MLFFKRLLLKLSKHEPLVPNFFRVLEELGINKNTIQDLDERGIIRIEKKLKARSKILGAYENQSNENLLLAIKKHHSAIICFFTDDMLYHLSQGKKFKEDSFIGFYPRDKSDLDKVRLFFDECLADDFLDKVQRSFQTNQIIELFKWHLTNQIFSASFNQKLASVLKTKLAYVIETLKQKPDSSVLKKRILYAKNKYFYKTLSYYKDDELTGLVYELMDFYNHNSSYTKGMDFADSLLLHLNEYDRNDIRLSLNIMSTTMNAGGSYKVMVIALLVIFSIVFGPIIYMIATFKPSLPKPYVMPTDFLEQRQATQQIYANRAVAKSRIQFNYSNNIDSIIPHAEGGKIVQLAGYKFKLDSANSLKTGTYLQKELRGSFNQILPLTNEQFYFVNNSANPVILLLYFNQCHFKEYDVLHPCPYPFAWNEMYVKGFDSVALSASVLDYFSIQTGKNLVILTRSFERIDDYSDHYYLWIQPNKADTMLYKQNFVNTNVQHTNGGRLVLTSMNNSYQLNWIGKKKAILHKEKNEYLKPNTPLVFSDKAR